MDSVSNMPARPDLSDVTFDWDEDEWRKVGQRLLDLAAESSAGWAERGPGAQSHGDELRAAFRDRLNDGPGSIDALVDQLANLLIPGSAYNGHPRWFAYITSSPSPVGVLGDMLASALNQNTALWRLAPAATAIEMQTIDWIKDLVGYPADAEGTFTSGGQMANIVAHAVFRTAKAPWDTRRYGMRGPDGHAPQLRVYTSQEAHYCQEQAAEMLGMGRDAVRNVPVDDDYRMRVDALTAMISEDRARGDLPIAIVATAGTVGTGAVDPLDALLAVARQEDLWLHVDGAYGAFAAMAPSGADALRHLRDADSIACDPHKWLFAPIDAGVTLIRKSGLLQDAFAFHPAYLEFGAASEEIDLVERTPENTRRFRALKVWLALQVYGRDGYSRMIERNIQLAAYMEQLIHATAALRLAAPRGLSIVCWRVEPRGMSDGESLDALQLSVIHELERRGIAMVSNARLLDGSTAIRACIVNFRTSAEDVEAVVRASAEIGLELAPEASAAQKSAR